MKSYKEIKISKYVFERTFDAKNKDLFEWHRDKEDRKIIVLESNKNWFFQLDNELPKELYPGIIITIPKNVFHRVIAGSGTLKIRLVKDFEGELWKFYF